MTSKITVLYDTIRLEEKLLIESAKKNDIDIEMVDCKKLFVDLNKNRLQRLQEDLDLATEVGHGSYPSTLKKVGADEETIKGGNISL